MDRRGFLRLSAWSAGGLMTAPLLQACSSQSAGVSVGNNYAQANLAANLEKYNALFTLPDMVDAWGGAIRPAGAGGHFWITAGDHSYEFIGDVNGEPLKQDPALTVVSLPHAAGATDTGAANGVVFNGIGTGFQITQTTVEGTTFTAPAKFIFVSDNGVISAWAQHADENDALTYPDYANTILDDSANNSAFFGLAINSANTQIIACDFGNNPFPRLRIFDDSFTEQPLNGRFASPFRSDQNTFTAPDYAPWAAHTVKLSETVTSVFVCYVKTNPDPDSPNGVLFATENTGRGTSKLVEYTEAGDLVAIWNDNGTLNGPWGVALAPDNFGAFSKDLLVTNFSDGTIVAFDVATKSAKEFMRGTDGNYVVIDGIWNILFGNGVKLGDTNALYFSAGPNGETEGLFGSLRFAG